ncbi:MAG: biotin/lipoyl-containing protein, partial [Alphaproteobacteria bacterium]
MATNILMPALSPTMTEGKLAKWRVKEGDEVKSGDLIAEIETDKATMEVEAVDEGRVARLMVKEGAEGVEVNAVIAVLAEEGEDVGDVEAPEPAKAAPQPKAEADAPKPKTPAPAASGDVKATPLARRIAEQAGVALDSVSPTGAHGKVTKADVLAAAGAGGGGGAAAPVEKGDRVFASPLARRLA